MLMKDFSFKYVIFYIFVKNLSENFFTLSENFFTEMKALTKTGPQRRALPGEKAHGFGCAIKRKKPARETQTSFGKKILKLRA